MKKKILIDAVGGSNWIGGVYYKKNILFSLFQNEKIRENTQIDVAVDKKFAHIFKPFEGQINIRILNCKNPILKNLVIGWWALLGKYDYCYSSVELIPSYLNKVAINWIPDFQHKYLL